MESENVSGQTPLTQPTPVTVPQTAHRKKYILFVIVLCLIGIVTLFFLGKGAVKSSQQQLTSQTSPSTQMESPQQQVSYTQKQLLAVTGSPLNTSSLPLGDNKYTTDAPKKGYIYLCNVQQGQGGASQEGNWIHGNTWNSAEKTSVSGSVSWSLSRYSNTVSGSNRISSGNDLPLKTTTGIFPVQATDPAYQYDRNPNTITAHNFTLTLPVNPTDTPTPACMGGEVGVMLNGVPLFNGFDAAHRDAPAHEVEDSCDGHPQESGEYHYHSLSRCIKDIKETTVIGYSLDGFPLTGPVLSNGNYLTTKDLDECHGMSSSIMLDGKETTIYHYVMTEDFPYSVSCFRGKPVNLQVIKGQLPQGNAMQPQQTTMQSANHPQPPQQAFTVCHGKTTGASCSFTLPRGVISGTCQAPPNQTEAVCVPAGIHGPASSSQ
ncbi:MAG: YHYH protein [Candidatus Levyibacteriota bacterium]